MKRMWRWMRGSLSWRGLGEGMAWWVDLVWKLGVCLFVERDE